MRRPRENVVNDLNMLLVIHVIKEFETKKHTWSGMSGKAEITWSVAVLRKSWVKMI